MISAKAAFSKTQEACERIFKATIDCVEEEIDDAICNGLVYCIYDGKLPEAVIKMLTDMGYSVMQCGLTDEIKYKIGWGCYQ